MKIAKISDVKGTDREVRCPKGGFVSNRLLLEKDKMGFSLHITEIPKGPPQHWHYTHHVEACYCYKGRGILINLDTGEKFEILHGTCYVLDNHDDHTFQAIENTVLVSVFNPPVKGNEVHQEDGSYMSPKEGI